MKIKAGIATFALCTTLAACSGGGGGGGGGGVFGIQANYVSSQSVQPFELIRIVVRSQNANAETFLRFSDGAGFDVVVPAIEVSDTQATAAVPPYENPATGQIEAGTVSVQVLQRSGGAETISNPFLNVDIAALPASAQAPGDLTLAFLSGLRTLLQGAQTSITGTTLDTAQNQATIQAAINDLGSLILNVTALQVDPNLIVDFGSIGGNANLLMVQGDLALADQLIAGLLIQQNAAVLAETTCTFTCVDAELAALVAEIAAGGPIQPEVDAFLQAAIDCGVQSGLPLAWRYLMSGTAIPSGALTESSVANGAPTALLLTQSYYGLGALSLAATLDGNTPNGVPEMLDPARDLVDLGSASAVAALAQAGGSMFGFLTNADDLTGISRTVPTFLQAPPCIVDLSGSWRGQYQFTITLPNPCPPSISNSGLLELDLSQTPPATQVTGPGQVTGLTKLNQQNCSQEGQTNANAAIDATTNGLNFDGDLTVFEPSAGLQGSLPFVGTLSRGLAGMDSISATFVFPDISGTFKLDRLEP